jgi:Insertion element 4 transposase N-terminal
VRERDLPAYVVMYAVIALALFMPASYREVLRCLLAGLQWLHDPNAIDRLRFTAAIAFRWAALAKPRRRRDRPSA